VWGSKIPSGAVPSVKRAVDSRGEDPWQLCWPNCTSVLKEDGVKIGEDFTPERHVYLIGDVSDVFPFDRDVIVPPYFKAIFDEELNSWYRLERAWPSPRTYETFLEWLEVELHSMVIDLQGSWLIRTEATIDGRHYAALRR
jgi:hypothetical protein